MQAEEWIYVPEAEGEEPWTGRITNRGQSGDHWTFEALRMSDNPSKPYDAGVFDSGNPIMVLIDHREKGTLIGPFLEMVEPKSAHLARTKISGSFQALLSGFSITDATLPAFDSFYVESKAFSAWYGSRASRPIRDEQFRTKSVELAEPETEEITIHGLGKVTTSTTAQFTQGADTDELRSRTLINVKFERPRSLAEVMEICLGIELLFGFLIGFRPSMPIFNLRKPANEDESKLVTGNLQFGGVVFQQGDVPHALNRITMRGRYGANLSKALSTLVADPVGIMNRIHAVEHARWFGASLNDQFAAVMPVFEEYLQANFKKADEKSYLDQAERFWKYVDDAPDEDLKEFSKKHLKPVNSKAPGLPTLIERAIAKLNALGFAFDPKLSSRINKRRAAMFHRAPNFTPDDAQSFYEEKLAVTAVLLLFTLEDLGVNLLGVSENLGALRENARFTKTWSEHAKGSEE